MELIPTIIAVLAFGLSLFNFFVDRYDKSLKLTVKLSHGVWKKDQKNDTFESGYIVEIINNSRIEVNIVDVRIELAQKKKPTTAQAAMKRIKIKSPLTKTGNKIEPWQYFSSSQTLENHGVSLTGGNNAYYWIPCQEVEFVEDYSDPFNEFDPKADIRMKAHILIAIGKSYNSNIIIFRRKKLL